VGGGEDTRNGASLSQTRFSGMQSWEKGSGKLKKERVLKRDAKQNKGVLLCENRPSAGREASSETGRKLSRKRREEKEEPLWGGSYEKNETGSPT